MLTASLASMPLLSSKMRADVLNVVGSDLHRHMRQQDQ